MKKWHEDAAHVVTFNYDTLVEATVDALGVTVAGERLTYKHVGPGVVPFWALMYGGMRLRPADTFTYWKLHGSTNWYWDGKTRFAESMVDVVDALNEAYETEGLLPSPIEEEVEENDRGDR